MVVLATHDDLQDTVNLRKRGVLPYLEEPPDGRSNLLQRYFELTNRSILFCANALAKNRVFELGEYGAHARRDAPWIACLSAAGLVALLQCLFVGLTDDTQMLMHLSAHMLFDGGLYTRWITVNSLIILWLYAPATLAASYLRVPAAVALHGSTVLFCLFSLWLTARQLRPLEKGARRLWMATAAFALLALPCATHTFADREHYLFILVLPWLLPMLLGLPGSRFGGALAATAFCIKPFNLVLLPTLILFGGPQEWDLRRKLTSPALCSIVITGTIYALILCLWFPDYLRAVLPMACATYAGIAKGRAQRLSHVGLYALLLLLLTAGTAPSRRTPFLALSVACAVIYYLNAGWTYTLYLLSAPLVLFIPGLWLPDRHPETNIRIKWLTRVCAVFVFAGAAGLSVYGLMRDLNSTAANGSALNHHHFNPGFIRKLHDAADGNFVLFSFHLWNSDIAALRGAPHSLTPYEDAPFPVAWLHEHPELPQSKQILQSEVLQPYIRALAQRPAPVLIVDESPADRFRFFQFSFFLFLDQYPAMRQALLQYKKVRTIDRCANASGASESVCRFSIWCRDDDR